MLVARYSDGSPVRKGDTLVSFRGESFEFVYASRPTVPGKSGKVTVKPLDSGYADIQSEYYVSVFGLERVDFIAPACGHTICDGLGAENEICRYDNSQWL